MMGKTMQHAFRGELSVRVMMIFISIAVICSDNRFWMFFSTWHGGSFVRVGVALLGFAALPIAYILYKDGHALKARYLIPCAVILVMATVYYRFGLTGVSMPTRMLVLIFVMYLVFSLTESRKALLLETFTFVFTGAMLLGLIYYLLRWAGIDLTTIVLESPNSVKTALGQYYSISPFGVLLNKRVGFDYCGYFDESGCLGTYAALLFIATKGLNGASAGQNPLRVARIVLVVEGFFSLSFAFYLIMGVYLLFQCVTTRKWSLLGALIIAIGAVFLVMNMQFENETLIRLQQRLGYLFNGGGSIDNRLTDSANTKMGEFFRADSFLTQLFGFGPGEFSAWQASHNVDGASVYYYLYDRGYIGMLLYFGSLAAVFFYASRDSVRNWFLLAAFIVSTYQRPEVFSSIYMVILMLGATMYCYSSRKDEDAVESRSASPRLVSSRRKVFLCK